MACVCKRCEMAWTIHFSMIIATIMDGNNRSRKQYCLPCFTLKAIPQPPPVRSPYHSIMMTSLV